MALIAPATPPRVLVIGLSGWHRVVGTAKKTGLPDVPVRRLVRLHRQFDGRLVAETWSDASTGAYAFNWIVAGVYYIAAFDHTGEYGGVIETDVVAEPMP